MTGSAILATACLIWADRADADSISKFFKPPKTNAGAPLSPAGLYPNGQLFPIGLYSVLGNSRIDPQLPNMNRVAQNGFTYAGPYYGDNWQDFSPITQAAGQNLKFVFQIRPPASVANAPLTGSDDGDDDGGIVAIPAGGLFLAMVPEPSTFGLMALAAFVSPAIRRKRIN